MEKKTIKDIIAEFEKMEEIILPARELTQEETLLYYFMKNDRTVSVTQEISLAEPIDFQTMQHALTLTFKRFPYFKVKVQFIKDRPYFVHNDNPLILHNKFEGKTTMLQKDNNGFLFRFEVDGNKLYMYNLHMLTDGRGKLPLVQTLLTFYYGLLGVDNTSALDSRYLSIPEDMNLEWENPFDHLSKEVPNIEFYYNERPCYRFPYEVDSKKRTFVYCIEVPVEDMMGYCKKVGGTPNTVVASAVAAAIQFCNPEVAKANADIKIGVIVDTKPAIGTPMSSINAFSMATLSFSKERKNLSGEQLHHKLKEELRKQASPEVMSVYGKSLEFTGGLLQTMPTIAARKMLAEFSINTSFRQAVTAAISYAGQSKLGDISSNVKSVLAVVESSIFDLLVEVNCLDDVFCISMAQSFDSVKYMYALKGYLAERGIRYYDLSTRIIPQLPFEI